jgi:hypothetical protein
MTEWIALALAACAFIAWVILVMDFAKLEARVERNEEALRTLVKGIAEIEQKKLKGDEGAP